MAEKNTQKRVEDLYTRFEGKVSTTSGKVDSDALHLYSQLQTFAQLETLSTGKTDLQAKLDTLLSAKSDYRDALDVELTNLQKRREESEEDIKEMLGDLYEAPEVIDPHHPDNYLSRFLSESIPFRGSSRSYIDILRMMVGEKRINGATLSDDEAKIVNSFQDGLNGILRDIAQHPDTSTLPDKTAISTFVGKIVGYILVLQTPIDEYFLLKGEKAKDVDATTEQDVRKMDWTQLVAYIYARNIDPWLGKGDLRGADAVAFDRWALMTGTTVGYVTEAQFPRLDGETDDAYELRMEKERIEYHKGKLWLGFHWLAQENWNGDRYPAANMESEEKYLTDMKRRVVEEDYIEGLMNLPETGDAVAELFDYAVEISIQYPPAYYDEYKRKHGHEHPYKGYGYADITNGVQDPVNKLKARLHQRYVEGYVDPHEFDQYKKVTTISEDYFKIAFDMFYASDMWSEALALSQQYTQTRKHNTVDPDPQFVHHILPVSEHVLARYDKMRNAVAVFLLFIEDLPHDWYHMHDVLEKKLDMIAFTECFFPYEPDMFIVRKYAKGASREQVLEDDFPSIKSLLQNRVDPKLRKLLKERAKRKLTSAEVAYVEEKKNHPTEVADYINAMSGFTKMLELVRAPMGGALTKEQIIGDGGAIDKFFTSPAYGKAKIIPGNHHEWMVPLGWYYVCRCLSALAETDASVRASLVHEIIEKFEKGSGLLKSDGSPYFAKIIHKLHEKAGGIGGYAGLPKAAWHQKDWALKRRTWADRHFKREYPRLTHGNEAFMRARSVAGNDNAPYKEWVASLEHPHPPFDRKNMSVDTSAKDKAK